MIGRMAWGLLIFAVEFGVGFAEWLEARRRRRAWERLNGIR